MIPTFKTNFEFYYDEDTMDLPQNVLESHLSDAAKNIYIFIVYFITENVSDVIGLLKATEESKHDFEAGFAQLLENGLLLKEEDGENTHYIVTKEFKN